MNYQSIPPPWAERLAGYFEGTLPLQERQRVADWLAQHPDVAAEFTALQEVQHQVRSASVPEPSERIWAAVRERIEQGLAQTATEQKAESGRGSRWGTAAWAAAAAGILVLVGWHHWTPKPIDGVAEMAFPIASPEDVEIVSVDAAGARALLVGEPPVQAALVMMAAGDATLKSVEIVPAGQFPEVWMGPGEQESPMIVAPFVAGQFSAP